MMRILKDNKRASPYTIEGNVLLAAPAVSASMLLLLALMMQTATSQ